MILGIDEVGRGPWAGPLVIGAVVLPEEITIEGLTDSKKLSAKRRRELDIQIREQASGYGLGWVFPEELDEIGLSAALRLATIRAVEAVKAPYHEIIIDGTINFLKDTAKGEYVTTLAKADALIPAVSAASVIAKVARDSYMEEQDSLFPEYGFSSHVGYGTARHQAALEVHGVTVLHRKSFAPIAKLLATLPKATTNSGKLKTATAIGNEAETAVARWLQTEGFTVIERNWKTKFCEIDIIATHEQTLYFIEVKYRSSGAQGGGIAAITAKKHQQMKFAAELYLAKHTNEGLNSRLAVASVDKNSTVELLKIE